MTDRSDSPSYHDSPAERYRKKLYIEVFDDIKVGVREKCMSPTDVWGDYTTEKYEGCQIINKICMKLLRGDQNYCLMLENILEEILSLVPSEIAGVSVLTKSSNIKDGLKVSCLALAEKYSGMMYPIGEDKDPIDEMGGIFSYCFSSGKSVISNNVTDDPRLTKKIPSNHIEIKKMVIIPLKYQYNVVGLLSLANGKNNYSLKSIDTILPLLEICTSLTVKSLDSRETLASRIQKINEIGEAKDKFLATMSHELRTPLNGIMGMITLFPDSGPLNDKQREYVRNLTECTIKLTGLLNNYLDFTKMKSDRLSLKRQPFSITEAVNDSVRIIRGNMDSKNLEMIVEIDKRVPSVIGDRQRIVQILSNLLSNAVKFTEKGFVSLKVVGKSLSEKKMGSASKWKICFEVKDTGLGISHDDQEKIFEVFYQSSNISPYLSQSGTGLGLPISRELVRLMGGKISVSSDGISGSGSTFEFYIIVDEEIDISSVKKEYIRTLTGSRILIVDDRSEIRLQLSEILFKWKCIPQAVSSADEALQSLQYGMQFKAALVDINMPQMSGIELAQEIRGKYPDLPLIGISSIELAGGEDYFDFYMEKPVDQNTLFPALLQCITKPRKVCRNFSRKKKSKKSLKILVAEDDPYNRYTINELLLNIGFPEKNITIVNDGLECVEKTKVETFDVILMDIIMPGMDGIEASKKIKRMTLPPMIIAVSAAVQPSDKAKCQNVGIDGYLAKPIIKDKLEIAISPLVRATNKRHKSQKSLENTRKYKTINCNSKLKSKEIHHIGNNKLE